MLRAILTRRTGKSRGLLVAQGLHGVDGGGTQGGDCACKGGGEDEECGDDEEDKRARGAVLGVMDEELVEREIKRESGDESACDGKPMLRETIKSTCERCAPRAMRIPNSLVRCATE